MRARRKVALRRLALHRVAKANGNMTIQSTLDLVCLVVANGFSTGPVQLDEDQRLRVRARAMSSQATDFYTESPLEIDRSNGPYKFTIERLRPGLLYDDAEHMCVPSTLFFNRLFGPKSLEQRARYVQDLRRHADWNFGPQRLLSMTDATQDAEELTQGDVDHWRPFFLNQRKNQVKCRWDFHDLLTFVKDMGKRCAVTGVKTTNLSVDR